MFEESAFRTLSVKLAICYAATLPLDGAARGIMFCGCPSICACVCPRVEVFSGRLAVDFCLLLFYQ